MKSGFGSALGSIALVGLVLLLAACTVGPAALPSGSSPAPVATPATLQVSESSNGQTFTVVVGSEVTILLTSTYWQIQPSSDSAVLAVVSGPTTSAAAPSACLPGMGCGTVRATFRALLPGQATISASRTTCGEALACTGSSGAYEVKIVVGPPGAEASLLASPEVICDTSQLDPTPSLTCSAALAVALAGVGSAHPAIVREEFRWGGFCPPGAPCVPPRGDEGIVVLDFASGPPLFIDVSSNPGGIVSASSPAPFPSGY